MYGTEEALISMSCNFVLFAFAQYTAPKKSAPAHASCATYYKAFLRSQGVRFFSPDMCIYLASDVVVLKFCCLLRGFCVIFLATKYPLINLPAFLNFHVRMASAMCLQFNSIEE